MTDSHKDRPVVSIIVPNYNHERYLPTRLKSILAQTFEDWELLILDDASTDGSMEVIEQYRNDPRVRILQNERNSGSPFIQWNLGVNEARGKYVWIAEADDEAEPEFLRTLVDVLDRNPQVVLAYCQSVIIDSQGRVTGDMHGWTNMLHPDRWRRSFINNGVEEVARYLIRRNSIPNASGVVFRRHAYMMVGGAPTNFRLCGDWVTYARLLSKGDIAYHAEALNRFRNHEANVRSSVGLSRNLQEHLEVIRILVKEFPVHPDQLRASINALSERWISHVQNSRPMPGLRWAWQTARALDLLGGYSMPRLLKRYAAVKAWRCSILRPLLQVRRRMADHIGPEVKR